jgi:hypothetical protein
MTGLQETGHRVLIVEDDPPTADDLRSVVESRGDRGARGGAVLLRAV